MTTWKWLCTHVGFSHFNINEKKFEWEITAWQCLSSKLNFITSMGCLQLFPSPITYCFIKPKPPSHPHSHHHHLKRDDRPLPCWTKIFDGCSDLSFFVSIFLWNNARLLGPFLSGLGHAFFHPTTVQIRTRRLEEKISSRTQWRLYKNNGKGWG